MRDGSSVIGALAWVLVLCGLCTPAIAGGKKTLDCQEKAEKYFQEHRSSLRTVKLDATLKNAPAQWECILKVELKSAREFTRENAECLNAFVSSVLSCPEGEAYGFAMRDPKVAGQDRYKEVEKREGEISKKLQDYIRTRPGLYSIAICGSRYEILVESFFPPDSEEKAQEWRHAAPPLEVTPMLSLAHGQKPTDPSAFQAFEIEVYTQSIPQTQVFMRIPVFLKGRYVCELWLNYCLCALHPATGRE